MSSILTKDYLLGLPDKSKVKGFVYIRTYNEVPKKTGNGTYITGVVDCIGTVPFKVWSGEAFDTMKEFDHIGKVCEIVALINDYNGVKSIVIDEINRFPVTDLKAIDFMNKKYNPEELWSAMTKTLRDKCSQEALDVFRRIIEPILDRFMNEFAAISHHDACVNGLLAHTQRVVKLTQIIKFYPSINETISQDALFIGAALHDIGKVLEYNNGAISNDGKYMNHLTLGLTLVMPHKEFIIEKKGIEFYDTLLSVIQQHHGEYGERPKTLAAYLIHKLDALEAEFTDISEAITGNTTDVIKCGDFILRV